MSDLEPKFDFNLPIESRVIQLTELPYKAYRINTTYRPTNSIRKQYCKDIIFTKPVTDETIRQTQELVVYELLHAHFRKKSRLERFKEWRNKCLKGFLSSI